MELGEPIDRISPKKRESHNETRTVLYGLFVGNYSAVDLLAGTCANRTHQRRHHRLTAGFEVRADHQAGSAPMLNEKIWQ